VGGVEVVGRSSGDLNEDEPKGSGACPPSGDRHGGGGGGWSPGYPGYGYTGGRQKPGPQVSQNPTEGGGGHVGGAPGAGDPPIHCSRVPGYCEKHLSLNPSYITCRSSTIFNTVEPLPGVHSQGVSARQMAKEF
jgi:hypothetical protein